MKINNGILINKLTDARPSCNADSARKSTPSNSASDSSDQMNLLLNILKREAGNEHDAERVQNIKEQVNSGQYSVHIPTLVDHLFQELSIDEIYS